MANGIAGIESFLETTGMGAFNGAVTSAETTMPARTAGDNMFVSLWKQYKFYVIGGVILFFSAIAALFFLFTNRKA